MTEAMGFWERRAESQRIRLADPAQKRHRAALARKYARTERGVLRQRCRDAVRVALERGLLTRERCGSCGAEHSEAHHPDYSRPLDVVWLCQPCHASTHAQQRGVCSVCREGHRLTAENTKILYREGKVSERRCRACLNARRRRRYAENAGPRRKP
jgi:hypothetical protein